MTTIQVRIDEKIKRQGNKIFKNLGLDMSSAIKLYLKKVIAVQGIPFRILTENGMTPQEEIEINKASEEAKRGVNISGPFHAKEAIAHLKKLSS